MKIEILMRKERYTPNRFNWAEDNNRLNRLIMCDLGVKTLFNHGDMRYSDNVSGVLTIRDRKSVKSVRLDVTWAKQYTQHKVKYFSGAERLATSLTIPKHWYNILSRRKVLYLTFDLVCH